MFKKQTRATRDTLTAELKPNDTAVSRLLRSLLISATKRDLQISEPLDQMSLSAKAKVVMSEVLVYSFSGETQVLPTGEIR